MPFNRSAKAAGSACSGAGGGAGTGISRGMVKSPDDASTRIRAKKVASSDMPKTAKLPFVFSQVGRILVYGRDISRELPTLRGQRHDLPQPTIQCMLDRSQHRAGNGDIEHLGPGTFKAARPETSLGSTLIARHSVTGPPSCYIEKPAVRGTWISRLSVSSAAIARVRVATDAECVVRADTPPGITLMTLEEA